MIADLKSDVPDKSSRRVLDPIYRVNEVLFGLIMVLTFTGSLSVAQAGRDEIRTMLIGALGCNLAWGMIDGLFYLMGSLADKGQNLMTYIAMRTTNDTQLAHRLIAGRLPPLIASILEPAEFESMRKRLKQLPVPPERAKLSKEDLKGAVGIFLLVFLSTFPVVIPFIFMQSVLPALRISNAIAITMMFIAGYSYGRITGYHPFGVGVAMVVLGALVVSATIALGG